MTVSQTTVVNALNNYCFENIWNSTPFEYAENLALIPMSTRFMENWIIQNKYINLPDTTNQYAVYKIRYDAFEGSLIIPYNTWMSTDDIGNYYQTLFHAYAASGLMLPKCSVYLYHDRYSGLVYVAILKQAVMLVTGLSNWNNLYLTVYRYLQLNNPLTITSLYVPNQDIGNVVTTQANTAISAALALTQSGTNIYINGYDQPTSSAIIFTYGNYVDVISDTTVVGVFSVNMVPPVTGYFSSMYNTYKNVLHCPKSVNPNNNIISVELLSLVARNNTTNVGLYVTKSAENSITSITHQDFGISTSVVAAMQQSLNTQNISIEVKIRTHNNILIQEINYIKDLYICNDATIVSFLEGTGDTSLPFWTASALEQSAYVGYISSEPAYITPQTLDNFITGLGYYTVTAILCQHVNPFPVNSLPMSNLFVDKPLILSGLPAYPVIYINGNKVPASQTGYITNSNDQLITGVGSNTYYTVGQTVTVDVIEGSGIVTPVIISPNANNNVITTNSSDVVVYQLLNLSTPVSAYDTTSSVSCQLITPLPNSPVSVINNTNNTTTITFNQSTYGNTYILQDKNASQYFYKDITQDITNGKPIYINLSALCNDGITYIPIIGYNSLDVYLNGNRLIPNIDYSAIPYVDSSNNTSIVQVMICNMSCLSIGNTNYLEVIARSAVTLNSEVGYTANNMMDIGNNINMWYYNTSMLFAGGQYQTNVTNNGDMLIPSPAVSNGMPFYMTNELPVLYTDVLSGYMPDLDDTRIKLINIYFNKQSPINDLSNLIIPESWTLYSPYLTAIYYDIQQNPNIEMYSNDPNDQTFLMQFAQYNYLMQNDPTVNSTLSKIDLRFCDINPCYTAVTVPNINNYTVLQRLATLVLTSDPNTLGDIVNA